MKKPRRRKSPKRVRIKKPKSLPRNLRVKIVKRDGRIQTFNRGKMFTSIRKAGASQQEAELVATRVSKRLIQRDTVPSKELSSMVARSLSRVNTTASRQYVDRRNAKAAHLQRVNRYTSEITAIQQQLTSAIRRIEILDDRIQNIPTRIARIRQGNYRLLTHLETDQKALLDQWSPVSSTIRSTTQLKSDRVQSQLQNLHHTLNSMRGRFESSISTSAFKPQIAGVRREVSLIQSNILTTLAPFETKVQVLDKDLRKAERTVALVSQASFPWEDGETPIFATRVKDLNHDLPGFITLTNRRFILEHEKEIILKKRLFIVTEKKTVREVAFQSPIGMVTQLVQGKVGFFKGAGVFMEFASESGHPDMKFDTSGDEAEWMTQSYAYIMSGEADDDLATITSEPPSDPSTPQLLACNLCGAPYTERIYRGQTSVNCPYCGAIIALQ
ncbi:MAG: hypothetical protein JSV76_03620 [Candidatus Bathyarchaeota archaeon]|nr:MAG: hypothetical protein JSV76_03620 [Candidatus Bathyarchaeota archaeon]